MRNTWLVIKYEILTTVTKRSFWFTTIFFPALILLMNVGLQVFTQSTIGQDENDPFSILPKASQPTSIGYVDLSRLIQKMPPGITPGLLLPFSEEAAAARALRTGQIGQYYLVPADYLESGQIVMVSAEFSPFAASQDQLFPYILNYNLAGDEAVAALLLNPTPLLTSESLAPDTVRDASSPLAFLVPFIAMFILFFQITIMSSFMLASVSREKENRTAEILLLSINPRQLMLGKLLGLGVVAMLQMAVWLGGSLLVLQRGQDLFSMAASFTLPPGFALWAMVYFMLGFLTFGALMGMVGVLAPSAREGNQFTLLVLLPLLLPLWLNAGLIQAPNGTLAVALSLFPLTAPTTMVMRMVATQVPQWQPLVGALLLAVTAYFITILSARFFRADNLLSGAELKWKRILDEFRKPEPSRQSPEEV